MLNLPQLFVSIFRILSISIIFLNLIRLAHFLHPEILNLTAEQIEYHLKKEKIIGDVIDSSPKHSCMVSYFEGWAAEFGNNIEPKELRYQPHWVRWTGDKYKYYSFLMIGPDEPSRFEHYKREYVHWLVTNVKGSTMLKEKDIIFEYVGPDPEKGTGIHRYVYLVYEQPDKYVFSEPFLGPDRDDLRRTCFSVRDFAKKYRFKEVPVAVNFIFSQWGPNASRVIPPRSGGEPAYHGD